MRILFCAAVLLLTLQGLHAQKGKNPYKYGDIKPEDFSPALHSFDSTADAVVLADIGYSYFRESNEGWFVMVFERHQRLKVLTKNGMDEANFVIPQYKSGNVEEKIIKLKAATFNLEGDKVVESKLLDKDIFKDQYSKYTLLTKFGLPNVKEGSILEVSYVIESDFLFNFRGWDFQGENPVVYTEYTVNIPSFFNYVSYGQGYLPFDDKTTRSNPHTYRINRRGNEPFARTEYIQLDVVDSETKWVMKNVPAMKREPFTTTLENHISKISFQLASYNFPNQPPSPVMSTWGKLHEDLMKDEDFGAHLARGNGWLDEDIKAITAEAKTPLEKAKALHAFMREKFAITETGNSKYLSDNPRNLWKNKKGKAADANIMLVTLLRAAGITADPVLISTREHGVSHEMYPLINEYNYVIGHAKIDEKEYYFDCTDPMLAFGKLPLKCYNGHSILLGSQVTPVYLDADDVVEQKTTMITIFNQDPEKMWTGEVSSRLGYYESHSIREKVKESGMGKVTTDIKNGLPAEVEVTTPVVNDLKEYDKSVSVKYGLDFSNMKDEDIIYLSPLLGERQKDNPFTAAERNYPVEMPYAFKEMIIFSIVVPQGYVVDELPKSTRVKLDENGSGMFEYLVQQTDNLIQGRATVELKQANFAAEAYDQLREFFIYVIKKQGEQIVLKKKANP